jgi:hypothetical protein
MLNNPFQILNDDSDNDDFITVVNKKSIKKDLKPKNSKPISSKVEVKIPEQTINKSLSEIKEKIINVSTKQYDHNDINVDNITKMVVNLDDFSNQKLNTRWCLWFHHDPNDWTKKGYKNIMTFDTIEDYVKVITHLHMVTSIKNINLYLFRENIEPTWEHEANSNGGCWSIKATMDVGFDLWRNIADKMVTENLLKTFGNNDLNGAVNGVSITNKLMNTIVKIWVSDRKVCSNSLIDKDISNQVSSKIIYQVISPER